MARNRKKLALYEVIGKSKIEARQERVEKLRPAKDKSQPLYDLGETKKTAHWPTKPRTVAFNAGRIEMSISYPVAITIVLVTVTLIVIAFWLGQVSLKKTLGLTSQPQAAGASAHQPANSDSTAVESPPEPVAQTAGNNRIVIKEFSKRADLEPAKVFFDSAGIKTEILKVRNSYFLVTAEKYRNPKVIGTNGYYALRRVTEVGIEYKAPPSMETFGPKPFQDAYGRKFDD